MLSNIQIQILPTDLQDVRFTSNSSIDMGAGMSSAKSFHLECLLHAENACSHPPPLPTPRDNDCMYFLLLWLVLSAITIIIVMLRAQKSMNSVSLYAAVL